MVSGNLWCSTQQLVMLPVPPSAYSFLRTWHYSAFPWSFVSWGNVGYLENWLWHSHQCWGCNTVFIPIIGRSCNVYGCLMFVSLKFLAWAWEGRESIWGMDTPRLTWKYPCFPYEAADGTVPFHSWSLKIPFCNPLLHILELSTFCTDVECGMWAASLLQCMQSAPEHPLWTDCKLICLLGLNEWTAAWLIMQNGIEKCNVNVLYPHYLCSIECIFQCENNKGSISHITYLLSSLYC